MYTCDQCNEDDQHSKYQVPVIVTSKGEQKINHAECCSQEILIEKLRQIVESEKMLYNDITGIVENFDEHIETFEKKYGTYEEHKSGIKIDKFVEALAIIDQLKMRK